MNPYNRPIILAATDKRETMISSLPGKIMKEQSTVWRLLEIQLTIITKIISWPPCLMHHRWNNSRRRCKRKPQIAPNKLRNYKCLHIFISLRQRFRQIVQTMVIRSNGNRINNISIWPNRSHILKRLVRNRTFIYNNHICRPLKCSTLTPASTRCSQPL